MYKFILLFLLAFSLYAEDEYELGKGVQVASLPFYLGAYFSADYRHMDKEDRYRLNDLALLGYGNYEKFSYMAEFEYKILYSYTQTQHEESIEKDLALHTERLYLDYNYNENYLLRVGKYNSPIGFWNLLPINVLRQTTSHPISTDILFPKFTTGLGGSYTSYHDCELHIDFMLQHNADIDNIYNNYKIDEHYGITFLYEKENYALKANAGYFHKLETLSSPQNLYYYLLSAKYESETYELLAEAGSQYSQNAATTPYAAYIQGLYRFTQQHIGSVRLESYKDNMTNRDDSISVFAYTYRPIYPVAFKSEYQIHSISQQNQFLFSISVLF
ncbi:MAG TPA: hypothetical protein CFH84_05705 [Sulfurimonas sp. UBA12504]|nr:MAG TPA: hypothetical protein CFH84_05705 [Sulfurimonas sp. UBA12504]